MKIYREKANIISEQPCWVIISGYYIYIANSLVGVIWKYLTERGDDKHLM